MTAEPSLAELARTAVARARVATVTYRWRAVDRAMRQGAPLPHNTAFTVLTTAITLIAVLVGVLVFLG